MGVPAPDLSTVEAALTDLRREKALAAYRFLEAQQAQNVHPSFGLPRALYRSPQAT
jgi:hypothetical protein